MPNQNTIQQTVSRLESHSYLNLWNESKYLFFARLVSDMLNPIFVPIFFFGIGLKLAGFPLDSYMQNIGIVLLFFTVIPFINILYFLSSNHIKTLDLPDRSNRKKPFLYTIISYSLGIIFLSMVTSPPLNLTMAFALCFLINALIGAVITLKWKISIHAAGVSCMITGFIFMDQYHLIASPSILKSIAIWSTLLIIPFMIWARLKLRLHTLNENLCGAVFGLVLTYVELLFLLH